MSAPPEDLAPPVRLALAYAPKPVRVSWQLLLRFDARMADIVDTSSEPLIGQMKLAWWRDAVDAERSARPKGEPLLASLSQVGDPALDRAAAALIDVWEALVVADIWTESVIDRFALDRGSIVFGLFAQLSGLSEIPALIGQQWAIADLRRQFGNRVPQETVMDARLPRDRALRPLTIMAMSVRDITGPRLVWHALTGR